MFGLTDEEKFEKRLLKFFENAEKIKELQAENKAILAEAQLKAEGDPHNWHNQSYDFGKVRLTMTQPSELVMTPDFSMAHLENNFPNMITKNISMSVFKATFKTEDEKHTALVEFGLKVEKSEEKKYSLVKK